MLLNELKPGLTYETTEMSLTGSGTNNAVVDRKFVTKVCVEETVFEGFGINKKMSKQACARAALTKIFGVDFGARLSIGSHLVPGSPESYTPWRLNLAAITVAQPQKIFRERLFKDGVSFIL